MKRNIQVMLVEDNREFRQVLTLAFEETPDIRIIAQFGTAENGLTRLQDRTKPSPEIVLLDLRLPGMGGLEALPYIRGYAPNCKVVILSQSGAEADVLNAIALGAAGYLLKSATASEIIGSIRAVLAGGAWLDPGVANYLLKAVKRSQPKLQAKVDLSQRELEILSLLGEGLLKKQIADRLNIGYSTVDTHVSHIYEKLRVGNAPAAIGKAYRLGLFTNE